MLKQVSSALQEYASSTQRVKVYRLNNEGRWDDRGTGHISVELFEVREELAPGFRERRDDTLKVQQSEAIGLVVISEEDTRPLLIHRIVKDDIYQRQSDDTIITWPDREIGTDIALSFAEVGGCNYIWEQIQAAQRPRQPDSPGRRRMVDEFEQVSALEGDFGEVASTLYKPVDLPAPTLANLPEIAKVLNEVTFMHKENMATQLLQAGYIRKVLDLFRTCEDMEEQELLGHMYHIVKGMIMLGDTSLLELLLNEENVMDVVGALEYEPGVAQRPKHREFLRDHVVFKEVVPICDPSVRARIHQSYQMGYIKDVILARVLDDQTFAALSSLILFYNHDVLMALQTDAGFFPELFRRLRNTMTDEPLWQDLVRFLQELCSQAKHLQPGHRAQLLNKLVTLGLFEIISQVMKHGDEQLQYKATDVLLSSVHHDPSSLRTYLLKDEGQEALFSMLVKLLLSCREAGLQEQILEVLRILLDPESMDATPDKDKFLALFYDKYISLLVGALAHCIDRDSKELPVAGSTLGLIVELLCFCVQHHGYRIKYYLLRNNVVEKVLKLLHRRERWLVVAAVRFLRTCIGLKDEFYNRYLVRNNLFDPVFEVFFENGDRYNLLNSAVLELVDFARRENIKSLIAHIMTRFYDRLEDVTYVETFKQLKYKFEQNQERDRAGASSAAVTSTSTELNSGNIGRRRRDDRMLDRDEENYFNEEEDDNSMNDTAQIGRWQKFLQSIPQHGRAADKSGSRLILRRDHQQGPGPASTAELLAGTNCGVGVGGLQPGLMSAQHKAIAKRQRTWIAQQKRGMGDAYELSLSDGMDLDGGELLPRHPFSVPAGRVCDTEDPFGWYGDEPTPASPSRVPMCTPPVLPGHRAPQRVQRKLFGFAGAVPISLEGYRFGGPFREVRKEEGWEEGGGVKLDLGDAMKEEPTGGSPEAQEDGPSLSGDGGMGVPTVVGGGAEEEPPGSKSASTVTMALPDIGLIAKEGIGGDEEMRNGESEVTLGNVQTVEGG